jgi:nitrogenase molybdenum-cofactor synthesis protein NifE
MLELVRQLALTLESPVWESVRKPSPWQTTVTSTAQLVSSVEAGE